MLKKHHLARKNPVENPTSEQTINLPQKNYKGDNERKSSTGEIFSCVIDFGKQPPIKNESNTRKNDRLLIEKRPRGDETAK